ncbi:hypothetical protein F7Q99_06320 [Streptomyces kaniharaensis]|uniref:Uncharacterized protein n=1 Tax=Streptomyces kaniharaensis TaxID=212423 RepID=A0A6N7KKD4_9ACTN|nr:hypothetical protein [Streptomyces kaniharaensis]MQS11916.1 hypothetical protein [Streptomyces kaniharaensis]
MSAPVEALAVGAPADPVADGLADGLPDGVGATGEPDADAEADAVAAASEDDLPSPLHPATVTAAASTRPASATVRRPRGILS